MLAGGSNKLWQVHESWSNATRSVLNSEAYATAAKLSEGKTVHYDSKKVFQNNCWAFGKNCNPFYLALHQYQMK